MRYVTLVGALLGLAACGPSGGEDNESANSAATSLPSGFPQAELSARGAECVVYLGLSIQANVTPAGRDAPIMQQAADQWQAAMRIDGHMSDVEVEQLIASSVNPLSSTSAAQRDGASAWCVDNAPEPDPEG
ncbi:hypothetical protein [Candidatus Viadribacter manganicus]|uniref:hypothetical protein n=1 Tax=Candidatus Viadribacter manganicus TaxID=1759059 RepID=UPI0012EA5BB2|nr:hypothetical protein [Candidatus Viadribacter manganicus]